jgi:hypothetical protein
VKRGRHLYGIGASALVLVLATVVGSVMALQDARGNEDSRNSLEECGRPVPATTSTSPALTGPTPNPTNAYELSRLADEIHRVGQEDFPEVYAGVIMDTDIDRLLVWRKPSVEFDAILAASQDREKIVTLCARYSYEQLLGAVSQLTADYEYWKAQGLTLHQFGPDYKQNCVLVSTEDPGRAKVKLTARYPDLPLCFEYGDRVDRAY